jgi:hypothetical protein
MAAVGVQLKPGACFDEFRRTVLLPEAFEKPNAQATNHARPNVLVMTK